MGARYVLLLFLVENHEIANNSKITEAREKISTYLESLEPQKIFDIGLTKLKKIKFQFKKLEQISTDIQAINTKTSNKKLLVMIKTVLLR